MQFKTDVKWLPVAVNIGIILACACVFIPFGYLERYMDSMCILQADIVGRVSSNGTLLHVDGAKSHWGDPHVCYFAVYMPVVVAIHAFIWTWFFVYVRKSLKEEGSEITLLIPVLALHGIVFVCMLVVSCILTSSFIGWCQNLHRLHWSESVSCLQYNNMVWSMAKDQKSHSFYNLFITSVAFSWIATVLVLTQCVFSSFILCTDSSSTETTSESKVILDQSISGSNIILEESKDTSWNGGRHNIVADVHSSSVELCPIITRTGDLPDDTSYQNS